MRVNKSYNNHKIFKNKSLLKCEIIIKNHFPQEDLLRIVVIQFRIDQKIHRKRVSQVYLKNMKGKQCKADNPQN